jgi:hypothetical protein
MWMGVLTGLFLVAALAGSWWLYSGPHITREKLDQVDMLETEAEVEAILGPGTLVQTRIPTRSRTDGKSTEVKIPDPGDYSTVRRLEKEDGDYGHLKEWVSNGWWVQMMFADGTGRWYAMTYKRTSARTLRDRLRKWLGL